jgi:uncharacterized membrane protein
MKPSKELKEIWRKDPDNWKFGFLYFNKEDKRILPPKKIKALGWTINFANPKSYIVFILLVLFIVGLSKLK